MTLHAIHPSLAEDEYNNSLSNVNTCKCETMKIKNWGKWTSKRSLKRFTPEDEARARQKRPLNLSVLLNNQSVTSKGDTISMSKSNSYPCHFYSFSFFLNLVFWLRKYYWWGETFFSQNSMTSPWLIHLQPSAQKTHLLSLSKFKQLTSFSKVNFWSTFYVNIFSHVMLNFTEQCWEQFYRIFIPNV